MGVELGEPLRMGRSAEFDVKVIVAQVRRAKSVFRGQGFMPARLVQIRKGKTLISERLKSQKTETADVAD